MATTTGKHYEIFFFISMLQEGNRTELHFVSYFGLHSPLDTPVEIYLPLCTALRGMPLKWD